MTRVVCVMQQIKLVNDYFYFGKHQNQFQLFFFLLLDLHGIAYASMGKLQIMDQLLANQHLCGAASHSYLSGTPFGLTWFISVQILRKTVGSVIRTFFSTCDSYCSLSIFYT